MPLMMEDEMDIDDLFGDGNGLSLPARPPTREIFQRLDELRASGCCQRIAWSKWGCIASITPDGKDLELRNLRCHPESGSWTLSEATMTPKISKGNDGGPLKHLSWSPTGCDLAVIDSTGRVTILAVFSSLNKPSLSRLFESDTADDLHSVVGCYWLNLAPPGPPRPAILHGPGVKEGSNFRYEASQAPILGPCHPNPSKSALICLTTNGVLRMLYPQNNSKWLVSQTELESIVSSDDLITHAAISPDKNGTLLIAFATTTKELRTVRALIEWNQPKSDKVPPAQLPLNPTIKTKHLAVTSWVHDIPGDPMTAPQIESSMVQLSQLEFLAPYGDSNGKMIPATVMVIRSHLPPSTSHFNQDVYTTIDRWEVREKPQNIHLAFEQLSSRRNSIGAQPGPVFYLKKLESITVNKIAITTEPMNYGKIILFAYSDGSVEYRDRLNMAETFNDGDLDRVWHLSQIGFSYSEEEACLEVALSPTFCSLVQIGNDHTVKWKQLDYHLGDIGSSMEDAQYSATITALTLACATAIMRNVNPDDLLATAKKHATAQFAYDWLSEISRILKVNADYSEEPHHDTLVRNTTIQLCLCIQNSLGFRGEFNPRTFSGKFAWLVLQLRGIVVLVTMAANLNLPPGPNSTDKTSPLEDPEVINSLAGSVRWILDLTAWVTDTLLSLPTTVPSTIDLTNSSTLSLPDLLAHLHATNNISLHLLLASSTRGFLTAICRRLQHLDFIARKAIMFPNTPVFSSASTPPPTVPQNQNGPQISPALRTAYMQIATLTSGTIIRIKTFETLLSALSALIKASYQSHTPSLSGSPAADKARGFLETKMLFGGSFPQAFKNIIVELFKEDGLLEKVKEEIDPARLFFADFTLLEVDEDAASVKKRKNMGMTIDCFRKDWMVNPAPKLNGEKNTSGEGGDGGGKQVQKWKRCSRCASVMEDLVMNRQQLQWLVMQQRRCFCSGYWNTLAAGRTFA